VGSGLMLWPGKDWEGCSELWSSSLCCALTSVGRCMSHIEEDVENGRRSRGLDKGLLSIGRSCEGTCNENGGNFRNGPTHFQIPG